MLSLLNPASTTAIHANPGLNFNATALLGDDAGIVIYDVQAQEWAEHDSESRARVIQPELEISSDSFYGLITKSFDKSSKPKIQALMQTSSLAIRFQKFADGRPYTLAQRLREMDYKGQMHALGDINQEVIHLLRRVGFTHVHLSVQAKEWVTETLVSPFSGHYQKAGKHTMSV